MKKALSLVLLCGALGACASTKPIPTELAAARNAYSQVTGSAGAQMVLAEIHVAKTALDEAEKAYKNDSEPTLVADLSYLAQRKAELAEALGTGALAVQEQAATEKTISDSALQSNKQKDEQLRSTREQLAKAQQAAKDALSQLTSLKNTPVKQEERGLVITLSGNVLFPTNKAELLSSARTQLADIAKALSNTKGQNIAIEGYTDASGSKERNDELSRRRAESVMNYLVDKGVAREHIKAVGRGAENPIADNKTAEGRATNRRVEIVVQAEGTAPPT